MNRNRFENHSTAVCNRGPGTAINCLLCSSLILNKFYSNNSFMFNIHSLSLIITSREIGTQDGKGKREGQKNSCVTLKLVVSKMYSIEAWFYKNILLKISWCV